MRELIMIGLGRPAGAVLWQVQRGSCLRIDDRRWSTCGGKGILSGKIVERLIEHDLVKVEPWLLPERDSLLLTEKGLKELAEFAIRRSIELAEDAGGAQQTCGVDPSEFTPTRAQTIYELAELAFEIYRELRIRKANEAGDDNAAVAALCGGAHLCVALHGGEMRAGGEPKTVALEEYLNEKDIGEGERRRRVFALVRHLANASMLGLTIGEMSDYAAWYSQIALEAFARAPDQDWEFDGGDEAS